MTYKDIYTFWFEELTPKDWFTGGEKLDVLITDRYRDLHAAVVAGEHADWRDNAQGALSEIIVLDQFSRNLYRGQRFAFSADGQALALAQVAIERGFAEALETKEKQFLFMPFMHSESKLIHEKALELFSSLGNEDNLKFEKIHKEIIDRFGRYPHRNKQMGRESTPEEEAFLQDNEYGFFSS